MLPTTAPLDERRAPGRGAARWDRARWLSTADRLLDGVAPFRSRDGARITPPGPEGGYGRAVDGLEGFARTFLLAALRLRGADPDEDLDDLADAYRRGVVAGVDPASPERWVRLEEHGQAKVEAASIALALDLTRPHVWDRLDPTTRDRVIGYLAPVVGDDSYPATNWLWFRVVVQTFLRSVGGPWSADDIAADLALHDSLVREDGWISDGRERSYDHYTGWALHLYPVLWARMSGAAELAAPRAAADLARLDRYLDDALHLVGGDGSPLLQGRSLIYRFAAAAPFWIGVVAGAPSHPLGRLRRAAQEVVAHFERHDAPDADGLLTLGWHGPWRALAQSYSGTGSPYWAVKGLLGIGLPAEHPVWDADPEPLPVQVRDDLRVVRAAGWIVSGTEADGIVRVVNHGTDHGLEGDPTADSPLYARLGYSTATAPLLDAAAWREPLDQSVALVDAVGRATHRTGFRAGGVRVEGDGADAVGTGSSAWSAHTVDPEPATRQHGSGLRGRVEELGDLVVHSLVRGPWEVRVARVARLRPGVDPAALRLRVGGWPLAGDALDAATATDSAVVRCGDLRSTLHALAGSARARVVERADASPLGARAAVPVLEFPVMADPVAVLVELAGAEHARKTDPSVVLIARDGGTTAEVTWPDGIRTTCTLHDPSGPDDGAPAITKEHHR